MRKHLAALAVWIGAAVGVGAAAMSALVRDASPRGPVSRPEDPRPVRAVEERRSPPQIAFAAPGVPGDNVVQEIHTMNLDGSNRRQITRDGLSKFANGAVDVAR